MSIGHERQFAIGADGNCTNHKTPSESTETGLDVLMVATLLARADVDEESLEPQAEPAEEDGQMQLPEATDQAFQQIMNFLESGDTEDLGVFLSRQQRARLGTLLKDEKFKRK